MLRELTMPEDKQEKLPLDAKLLSDAVIELNISRRSVGLYPPEHPIVRTSIERAFQHLQKLFEIRVDITLGIAKDALVVDEYTLDRRNPVFREFAQSLHAKGIAAVTFSSGLGQADLTRLHEMITGQDMPIGKELAERAENDIRHIVLSPIELDKFCFMEGEQRQGPECADIWEDYVYGLLEGKLTDADGSGLLSVPEEAVADVFNNAMTENSSAETYDRVITAYIRKKGESRMSRESFYKFFSLIDRLKPEIKKQFLTRTGARLSEDVGEVEEIISKMTPESFEKVAGLLTENASLIPTTLKNLIDKLSSIKQVKTSYFDMLQGQSAVLDDIELGEDFAKLFGDDHFRSYVSMEYQKELERMLESKGTDKGRFDLFRQECEEEVIDKTALDIMLELLSSDNLNADDYMKLLTKLSEFMNSFLETGRFEEILDAYNTLSSQALNGRFRSEASSILDYFFHSEDFIARLVEAFTLYGRKDREGAVRLAKAMRRSVVNPLLGALLEERDASMRKFLLSLLGAIGSDVLPYALRKLNDERWFVLRNMIWLVRECNGAREIEKIRKFLRHENAAVRMETLKTLLHFRTADAIPHLRAFLQSEEAEIRQSAIRLAGSYRITETVPYLLRYLEKKDLFGTESYYKIDIVRALGEIGDPAAAGTLKKILNAKTLFYRGNLEELKVEIFRTLGSYPYESVRGLIEQGLGSKNEEIHGLSEKYLVSFHASGGKGD